jgi:hypothetical protein
MRTSSTFSLSEEAFLLNSLHEIVKIWASGSGKASFSLDVRDGKANRSLGFQLGHPSDQHYDPGAQPHQRPPHDQQQDVVQQKRRHKGPNRREKDRARAAAHQARLQSAAAAPAKCDTADPAVIKLPFSGKLLPLKRKPSQAPHHDTTPSTSSLLSPTTPKKLTSTSEPTFKKYLDVSIVKKQLFPHQLSQGDEEISTSQNYQKREKKLWTRLFETSNNVITSSFFTYR